MEQRTKVTRIDFTVAGDIVVVNKIDDQTVAGRAIVINSCQYLLSSMEEMLSWCEANSFVVRRYFPLGARAWFGRVRPVRTAGQIQRKRSELTRYPVEGLQIHTVDLAYDC